jgi:hypothetical protein
VEAVGGVIIYYSAVLRSVRESQRHFYTIFGTMQLLARIFHSPLLFFLCPIAIFKNGVTL